MANRVLNIKGFDKEGITNCVDGGNDTIIFNLARGDADKVRDKFIRVLPIESSPIWFNIRSESLHRLLRHPFRTSNETHPQRLSFLPSCEFGSLQSHNQFYSHTSFNNKTPKVFFKPDRQTPNSLYIEFDDTRIVIPFNSIQKRTF